MIEDVLPDTAQTSSEGHLSIGGCDTTELAARYGTPLIVFDRATFEARAAAIAAAIGSENVFYAGKSFLCVAVCQLVDELGLGLDVCSGGELTTAVTAGFPSDRLLFHGNNKSVDELKAAAQNGVGRIVVDSFDELRRIDELGIAARLLVRVTPGVEARTHGSIRTGQEDSKFGFSLSSGAARDAVAAARSNERCDTVGLHAHIGSQMFDLAAFDLAVGRMVGLMAELRDEIGFQTTELNLGGGFGIPYTAQDDPLDLSAAARGIVETVRSRCDERALAVPRVMLEPGRAISGNAGVTLYEVGTVKPIVGVRTYVSVDGGMSDNPRPALYGARYEALMAGRLNDPCDQVVTIAGKHCETGDVLITDARLPRDVRPGDLLCVPATGAYSYSMASTYNRNPRPAVVLVAGGEVSEIVARESSDDLLRLDLPLPGRGESTGS